MWCYHLWQNSRKTTQQLKILGTQRFKIIVKYKLVKVIWNAYDSMEWTWWTRHITEKQKQKLTVLHLTVGVKSWTKAGKIIKADLVSTGVLNS